MKRIATTIGFSFLFFSCDSKGTRLEGTWREEHDEAPDWITTSWTFRGEKFIYSRVSGRPELKWSGNFQIKGDSVYLYTNHESVGIYKGKTLEQHEVEPVSIGRHKFILKKDTLILVSYLDSLVYNRIK